MYAMAAENAHHARLACNCLQTCTAQFWTWNLCVCNLRIIDTHNGVAMACLEEWDLCSVHACPTSISTGMTAAWKLNDLVWGSVPAQHLGHILALEPGHCPGCCGCTYWLSSMMRITCGDFLRSPPFHQHSTDPALLGPNINHHDKECTSPQ